MRLRVVGIALLAVSIVVGASGCSTRIRPGYVGIKVNASGSNRGVEDYPITTGRVWYNPFTTSVLEWPTFVQTTAWTHDVHEGHPVNEEITFTTADQMSVAADISIGYELDAAHVPHFYVKFRTDDMDQFTHGFLRNLAREKFDMLAGRYRIDQIMGDNGPFLNDVRASVQREIEPYGVKLDQFGFIGAPRPPQSVIDSINAKVKATQIALQTQNEVATAQAEGQKRIATAQAEAQAIAIRAQAEAAANQLISRSLTSELVDVKRLEKWDGHLPQVAGAANPFVTLGGRQ